MPDENAFLTEISNPSYIWLTGQMVFLVALYIKPKANIKPNAKKKGRSEINFYYPLIAECKGLHRCYMTDKKLLSFKDSN